MLFQASCSIVAATGPETRKSTAGSTKRRAKRAQSDPKGSPEVLRTPPGRPKMVEKAPRGNKGGGSWGPRAAQEVSGVNFGMILGPFGLHFGTSRALSFLSLLHPQRRQTKINQAKQTQYTQGNQRHSLDPTRWAGGVIPTWSPPNLPLGGRNPTPDWTQTPRDDQDDETRRDQQDEEDEKT